MSEHTELPWCIPAGDNNAFIICSGGDPTEPGEILMVVRAPAGRRTVASDHQVNANVALMVKAVNNHDALVKALTEIVEGRGAFSNDRFLHACNTIADMKQIAQDALDVVGQTKEEKTNDI